MDLSDEIIFIVDLTGRFTYISKNVERYGYKVEEIIGRNFIDFIHEEEKYRMKKRFEEALKMIREHNYYEEIYKTKAVAKNGSPIDILVHVYYLKHFGSFLCILKDISNKKDLYEKLEVISKRMEFLKKILRRNIIAIDIISHDILNLITSIKNYIQILKDYNLEENVKNIIKRIDECSDRIIDITRNCLKLAKLQRISEFELIDINLKRMVNSVINSLKYKADRKNISIINNVEEIYIKVNPIFINVIENLLDNAIKYSPENSEVIIESKVLNDKVRIYVKDFGIGIPDEYKKRIFERFERGSKLGIKGTGLGLAIVKRIVELHNGKVWVEDNKPKGSVFIVEIPR